MEGGISHDSLRGWCILVKGFLGFYMQTKTLRYPKSLLLEETLIPHDFELKDKNKTCKIYGLGQRVVNIYALKNK